jgi:hypothetical protein
MVATRSPTLKPVTPSDRLDYPRADASNIQIISPLDDLALLHDEDPDHRESLRRFAGGGQRVDALVGDQRAFGISVQDLRKRRERLTGVSY